MGIDIGASDAWKNSFKLRFWALGVIIFLPLGIIALFSLGSMVGSYISSFMRAEEFSAAESMSGYNMLWPLFLVIVVLFLSLLSFNWIPRDIALNLGKTLTTLGWVPVSGFLQRGFCKFAFGGWELSITIHVYTPSSHQWGSVTLLLAHSNPTMVAEENKRFQEGGYGDLDPAHPGGFICHTTIPNLPWQVLRLSSLAGVTRHTTTFS